MVNEKSFQKKPFFDATKDVFKSMLDIDIGLTQEKAGQSRNETVKVEIPIIGDLSGVVVYDFPKSTTLNIVKTLSGMDTEDVDDFATSMLGEMANIISGNAVSCFSEMNYKCDIKPPKITISQNGSKKDNGSQEILLTSSVGKLSEYISLNKN